MSLSGRVAAWILMSVVSGDSANIVDIKVDFTSVINEVDDRFVSWNIDLSENRQFFELDFREGRLQALGRAIAPAFLRVGGGGSNVLSYAVSGSTGCERFTGLGWKCLEEDRFRALCSFVAAANVQMIFGLNIFHHGGDGKYDPSNAKELLSFARTIGCPIFGVELGNEVDKDMTARAQAEATATLYGVLQDVFPDQEERPRVIGPDPHGFHLPGEVAGEKGLHFIHVMGNLSELRTPLYAATHHEYIEVGAADNTTFYTSSYLQIASSITADVAAAFRMEKRREGHQPSEGPQLWGGEVGPHNGGSPPCDASSERWSVFADGFWYLHNLGSKALNGYSVMCRQDFIGIDYGLLDCASHLPNPDFYTALLWKRLLGNRVLAASSSAAEDVLAFAHCLKNGSGGVVVVLLNLADRPLEVVLGSTDSPGSLSGARSEYQLTATRGLMGQGLALNGIELQLGAGDRLPELKAREVDGAQPLVLAARSYAFVAVPGANAKICSTASESLLV